MVEALLKIGMGIEKIKDVQLQLYCVKDWQQDGCNIVVTLGVYVIYLYDS